MQIPIPICQNCKNFTPDSENEGLFYCKAFPTPEKRTPEDVQSRLKEGINLDPKGIPDDILFGENDHIFPIEGQVGDFVFTPVEE